MNELCKNFNLFYVVTLIKGSFPNKVIFIGLGTIPMLANNWYKRIRYEI